MSGAPAEPRLVITPNSALPGDREKPQRYTGGLAAGGSWAEAAAAADVPTWVVNKEPTCLTPALYAYLLEHTREPAVLQELREETARLAGGWMQIAPEQGQLLALLAEIIGARQALDVGLFTGYSALSMALALPPDGCVVGLDRDASVAEVARRYFDRAGCSGKLEARVGPAADTLQQLLDEGGEGSFDMAFLDADKVSNETYYPLVLRLVRAGGLLIFDNALFYGQVVNEATTDRGAVVMRRFNAALLRDERVSMSLLPVGDGTIIARKR